MNQQTYLPIEIKLIIFKYLDLQELMVCRLVNRRWRDCVEEFRFRELAIVNTESDQFTCNKYHSYKTLNQQNLFEPSDLRLFQSVLSNKMFNYLEYLNISNHIGGSEFDLEFLNRFDRLQQLDLSSIEVSREIRLELPFLKVLSILQAVKAELSENESVEFNSPKLQIVRCNEHFNTLIKILNPKSIKSLQVNLCESDLANFSNIEVYKQNFALNVRLDILTELPKLRELHLFTSCRTSQSAQMKHILIRLIEERQSLRRFDLQIHYMGMRLACGGKLSDQSLLNYDFGGKMNHKLHLKNYDLLSSELPFFDRIDYDSLINAKHSIPSDFCRRFNNIQNISAIKVVDQNEFIRFLSKCSNLIELNIHNSSLDQEFYDRLPQLCSLVKLKIEKQTVPIVYEFICKFKRLIQVQIDYRTDPLISLFTNIVLIAFGQTCKYLRHFEINNREERVNIKKYQKENYSFRYQPGNSNHYYAKNDCLNDLINCESIVAKPSMIDRQNINFSELNKLSRTLLH